jgi:hypothetical protein
MEGRGAELSLGENNEVTSCYIAFYSGSIPSIEDIFMSKLNEIDTDNDDLLAHPKAKEFIKQIWNVNHKGQPLPTEQIENDDSDLIIAQVL